MCFWLRVGRFNRCGTDAPIRADAIARIVLRAVADPTSGLCKSRK